MTNTRTGPDDRLLSSFPASKIKAVGILIRAGVRWDAALQAAERAAICGRTDQPVQTEHGTITFDTRTREWTASAS